MFSKGRSIKTFLDLILNKVIINIDEGPWIAGGAAIKLYENQPLNRSDIDLFVKNEEQIYFLIQQLSKIDNSEISVVTENAITFNIFFNDDVHQVQIIRKHNSTAQDVIDNFDFTCCQVLTDGKGRFIFGKSTIDDLKNKTIRLNPNHESIDLKRISKYLIYGFRVSDELNDRIQNLELKVTNDKTIY